MYFRLRHPQYAAGRHTLIRRKRIHINDLARGYRSGGNCLESSKTRLPTAAAFLPSKY